MKNNPYSKGPANTYFDKKTNEPFNPKNFGQADKYGNRTASEENLFDNSGNLNASDKAEAFDKIAAVLGGMQDGKYDVYTKKASSMFDHYQRNATVADDEAYGILREALANPQSDGFRVVGENLLNPIKEVLDYEGMARKVFMPRNVKSGETIRYDKDQYVMGYQIAEDGQTPQSVQIGQYYYPPECDITCYPSIEVKDQFRAQFDIMARIQDRARQAIEYQEDLKMVNVLQAAANASNSQTYFTSLNLAALESLCYQIERHRLITSKILIHRQELGDIRTTLSQTVDPLTQREIFMSGYIANFFNAQIITTAGTNTYEILQPGEVLAVTDAEHLGGMPIRVELYSEPVSEFVNGFPRRGWFYHEVISMFVANPAGVSAGSKI